VAAAAVAHPDIPQVQLLQVLPELLVRDIKAAMQAAEHTTQVAAAEQGEQEPTDRTDQMVAPESLTKSSIFLIIGPVVAAVLRTVLDKEDTVATVAEAEAQTELLPEAQVLTAEVQGVAAQVAHGQILPAATLVRILEAVVVVDPTITQPTREAKVARV
jgi:hypothetical protein